MGRTARRGGNGRGEEEEEEDDNERVEEEDNEREEEEDNERVEEVGKGKGHMGKHQDNITTSNLNEVEDKKTPVRREGVSGEDDRGGTIGILDRGQRR